MPTSLRQVVSVPSGSRRTSTPSVPLASLPEPSGFTLLRMEPSQSEPRGSLRASLRLDKRPAIKFEERCVAGVGGGLPENCRGT